jgi:protein TonB
MKELNPVRIGGGIRPPTKIFDVKPVYTPIAMRAGVQGVVIIEAVIDQDGDVAAARVLRSIPLLDEAALDAVKEWKYAPTTLNGVPQAVIMTVTVNFHLQ